LRLAHTRGWRQSSAWDRGRPLFAVQANGLREPFRVTVISSDGSCLTTNLDDLTSLVAAFKVHRPRNRQLVVRADCPAKQTVVPRTTGTAKARVEDRNLDCQQTL